MEDSKPKQEYPKDCALCGDPTTGNPAFELEAKWD